MIHLIATLIALAGLLAALGNGAYLLMLDNVAKKRPGGQITRGYVKKQLPLAGGATAGAVFALLLTSGGVPSDIIATLLGVGVGGLAWSQLTGVRKKYGSSTV